MELYQKVMKGKKTTYELWKEPPPETVINLTDGQCVTAAGALGATLLIIFERHIPPHKRVAKKIKKVEEAILELFAGCGEHIDNDVADFICKAWDKTVRGMTYEKN